MADKKITELTNITGANLVDADEFVVVDISADETKAITLGELKEAFDSGSGFVRITGDTMTGDLALSGADVTFGDNDKAIFGAGSDLQIYHDGNSKITDVGDGKLELHSNGTGVTIQKGATEYMAQFLTDGAVQLYYDGGTYPTPKLATTATGIDVTGTVTADAYALDSIALPSAGTATIFNRNTDNSLYIQTDSGNTVYLLDGSQNTMYAATPTSHVFQISNAEKMRIDASGNVGIGTSSPIRPLSVKASQEQLTLSEGDARGATFDYRSSTGNLNIATNGVNARTSPQLTLDLNGRLGIGTSSPSYTLTISTTDEDHLRLENGSELGFIRVLDSGALDFWVHGDNSTDVMTFTTGTGVGTERMRIDSSGNVGIGTSSPVNNSNRTTLGLQGVWGGQLDIMVGSTVHAQFGTDNFSSGQSARIQSQDGIVFKTNGNNERMRIDSSGNLLVGKTTTSSAIAGTTLWAGGYLNSTVSSDYVGRFNRLSTDGEIVQFQKDGSTVGSIGVGGSGDLYIGDGDTALLIDGESDLVAPWNTSTNLVRDNAIDLGYSSGRFKDLYLSGGVYLGGTGSANKLDDYEAGTFTVGFSGATVSAVTYTGFYTKIGQVVHWNYFSQAATISGASGTAEITGLPFTVLNSQNAYQPIVTSHNTFFGGSATAGVSGYQNINNTSVTFLPTGGTTPSTFVNGSSLYIMVSGTYITAS